jgi:hypothetical protein
MGIPEIFNYLGAKRNVEAKILKKKIQKSHLKKKNPKFFCHNPNLFKLLRPSIMINSFRKTVSQVMYI